MNVKNRIEAGLRGFRYHTSPYEGGNELGKKTAMGVLRRLLVIGIICTAYNFIRITDEGIRAQGEEPQSRDGTTHTVYTVRPRDTLWSIAKTLNANLDCLVRVNGIKNRDLIFSGQKLKNPRECQIAKK